MRFGLSRWLLAVGLAAGALLSASCAPPTGKSSSSDASPPPRIVAFHENRRNAVPVIGTVTAMFTRL